MKELAVCLIMFCGIPYATELTDEQAAAIYAVAYGQYKFLPEHAPTVRVMKHSALCEINRFVTDCPIFGLYQNGEISISDRLDFSNPKDSSVLLHEYIHYFQEQKFGPVTDCRVYLEREYEAYSIQAAVLRAANEQVAAWSVMMNARQLRCKP